MVLTSATPVRTASRSVVAYVNPRARVFAGGSVFVVTLGLGASALAGETGAERVAFGVAALGTLAVSVRVMLAYKLSFNDERLVLRYPFRTRRIRIESIAACRPVIGTNWLVGTCASPVFTLVDGSEVTFAPLRWTPAAFVDAAESCDLIARMLGIPGVTGSAAPPPDTGVSPVPQPPGSSALPR